jgi:prepilin-type processing-associated H-X9-DG protein
MRHLSRLDRHCVELCCLLVLCCAWQSTPPSRQSAPVNARSTSKIDLTTPAKAIESFLLAVSSHNDLAASLCVVGGKPSPSLNQLQRLDNLFYYHVESTGFASRSIQAKIDGGKATATLKVAMVASLNGREFFRSPETEDRVELQHVGADWKIVPQHDPAALEEMISKPETMQGHMVSYTASVYAFPDLFVTVRRRAIEVKCRQNLKVMCLLALEHSQDHHDTFGFKPAEFKTSLFPYYLKLQNNMTNRARPVQSLLDEETRRAIEFHCPLDAKGEMGYAFNANLYRVPDSAIKDPARTVLFYEGKNGKLAFRHNGRANVGFADGHVETIDAAAAKQLVWLPSPGSRPKP